MTDALRSDPHFAQRILETIDALIVVLDPQGRIVLFNRGCECATGYTFEEVRGRAIWDVLTLHEEVDAVREVFRDLAAGDTPSRHENYWRTKDGGRCWISWSNSILTGEAGEVAFVIGTGIDRTTQRRAEESLAVIVENAIDAIVTANEQGDIETFNAAATRLFGYTAEEAVGSNLAVLMPEPHADSHDDYIGRYLTSGEKRIIGLGREVLCRRKDGSTFPAELGVTEAHIAGRRVFTGILRDLTERKRLESSMQQAQKLESLGVLAGGIAHDFNNLLMSIRGLAGVALQELDEDDKTHDLVARIEKAALRASDLTKQMLAYSGKAPFEPEFVRLPELVEEMGALLAAVISKNVVIEYDLAADTPGVEGSPTQLRQVVMNLITNASDACAATSGRIVVRCGRWHADAETLASAVLHDRLPAGTYAFIEVADTGVGMDTETRARMFDPFFTTKFGGHGLGLAAALGIVRGHNGGIRVDSEPEKGARIRVVLPCAEAPENAAGETTEPDDDWRGTGTILVVDDDEDARYAARLMLRKAGFDVVEAKDGFEAIELLSARPDAFRAVLLDLTMPGMDGSETCRKLRGIRPGIIVIVASGYGEQETARRFPPGDCAGFIQKPFGPKDLARKLREIL